MKAIRKQLTSSQLISFLVLVLISGFGIHLANISLEITNQMIFMDFALAVLIFSAGVKFILDKSEV
jgi:hypothetical protein